MKTSLRLFTILVLTAATSQCCAADAKSTAELVTTAVAAKPPEPRSINIDFPGGSISKFLATMAKAEGVSFSVVSADGMTDFDNLELPAFSLRNVSLIAISEVLRNLVEPHGFKMQPIAGGDANSWVCVLQRSEPASVLKPLSPNQFTSYQLSPYLEEHSVDDIVSAIRTGWELDPAHDRNALRLKFHPATSVLLVSGPSDAIMVTTMVLANINHAAPKKTPANPNSPPPPAEKK